MQRRIFSWLAPVVVLVVTTLAVGPAGAQYRVSPPEDVALARAMGGGGTVLFKLESGTCPVDGRVINPNPYAVWNVDVESEFSSDDDADSTNRRRYGAKQELAFRAYLPYIPARMSAMVRLECGRDISLGTTLPRALPSEQLSSAILAPLLSGSNVWQVSEGAFRMLRVGSAARGLPGAVDDLPIVPLASESTPPLPELTLTVPRDFEQLLPVWGSSTRFRSLLPRRLTDPVAQHLDLMPDAGLRSLLATTFRPKGAELAELLTAYLEHSASPGRVRWLVSALEEQGVARAVLITTLVKRSDRAPLLQQLEKYRSLGVAERVEILRQVLALGNGSGKGLDQALVDFIGTDPALLSVVRETIAASSGQQVLVPATVLASLSTSEELVGYLGQRSRLSAALFKDEEELSAAAMLAEAYGNKPGLRLTPEALDLLDDTLAKLQEKPDDDQVRRLLEAFAPFGLSGSKTAERYCARAQTLLSGETFDEAAAVLAAADAIKAKHACIGEAKATLGRARSSKQALTLLRWGGSLLALIGLGYFLVREQRKKVRERPAPPAGPLPSKFRGRLAQRGVARTLRDVVAALARAAASGQGPGAQAAAGALELARDDEQLLQSAAELIRRANESGDLSSTVLSRAGSRQAYYVLVFPNLHDHPHALRRWAALRQGWTAHLERARLAVAHSFQGVQALLTIAVFVDADATSGSACADFREGTLAWLPRPLLDPAEARAHGDTNSAAETVRFELTPVEAPATRGGGLEHAHDH